MVTEYDPAVKNFKTQSVPSSVTVTLVGSIVREGLLTSTLQVLVASEMVAVSAKAALDGPRAKGERASEKIAKNIPNFESRFFLFETTARFLICVLIVKIINYIDDSAHPKPQAHHEITIRNQVVSGLVLSQGRRGGWLSGVSTQNCILTY
jgi:hypothetical protein